MKRFLPLLCLLFPFALLAAPKNIIVMVPDGTGFASVTAARHAKGEPLALEKVIYGTIETRSADNSVTDSAAAATAMACGERTYNGAIGVNQQKVPLRSISEWARAQGKAVGIVTTDKITGATPSGFSAHVPSRSNSAEILAQQITSGFEVFLGGGRKDLTETHRAEMEAQGYQFVTTEAEMDAVQDGKLFGLFSSDIMTAKVTLRDGTPTTEPTLPEMAAKALDLLAKDPDGFFLMVEGAQVDKGNHENDLPWATYELLDFDDAVAMVLAWAEKRPDTLVLIAPDHETGGLTLLNESAEGARGKALRAATKKAAGKASDYAVHYSSTWHTGVDVFLAGNQPAYRPMRNCDMLTAITGESAQTLAPLEGETLQDGGVTYLRLPEGKTLRAQYDAIYIPATGKWYQR